MTMKDLRQERLQAAHGAVVRIVGDRRAGAELEGLPVLVLTQGLPTALASLAKSAPTLSTAMVEWLARKWPGADADRPSTRMALIGAYVRLEASAVRALEHEALQFADAMKLVSSLLRDR